MTGVDGLALAADVIVGDVLIVLTVSIALLLVALANTVGDDDAENRAVVQQRRGRGLIRSRRCAR